MTVWDYAGDELEREVIVAGIASQVCPYCGERLQELPPLRHDEHDVPHELRPSMLVSTNTLQFAAFCPQCGWWKTHEKISGFRRRKTNSPMAGDGYRWLSDFTETRGTIARLKNLDIGNIDTPLSEVKQYLVAKWSSRFDLHPRLFEDVVASVFRDVGYTATVTAYSADGGIDAILKASDGETIGVQVKRYKNRISVEQIRSFVGALLLRGITKGIYVTTSAYERGCDNAALQSTLRGIPIELLDAERFFDHLGISQRKEYKSATELLEKIPPKLLTTVESASQKLPPYI